MESNIVFNDDFFDFMYVNQALEFTSGLLIAKNEIKTERRKYTLESFLHGFEYTRNAIDQYLDKDNIRECETILTHHLTNLKNIIIFAILLRGGNFSFIKAINVSKTNNHSHILNLYINKNLKIDSELIVKNRIYGTLDEIELFPLTSAIYDDYIKALVKPKKTFTYSTMYLDGEPREI